MKKEWVFRMAFKILSMLALLAMSSCSNQNDLKTSEVVLNTDKQVEIRFELAKNAFYMQDYEVAIKQFLALVGKYGGEPEYFLALAYLNDGDELTTERQALNYLQSSVDAGYLMAMWEMGRAYENGIGVDKDYLKALDWYRKHKRSTVTSLETAQYFVTIDGDRVNQSYQQVFQSLLEKASAGDVEAQVQVAGIYDDGMHVQQDERKAFYWYSQAAKTGNDYAQLMLGYFYCRAIGVDIDVAASNYWFNQSKNDISCH